MQRGALATLPRRRPWVGLAASIPGVELVGASGSVFTAQGLGAWYDGLAKPGVAPPNWVFAPVWTTLFAMLGVAVFVVWRQAPTRPRRVRRALAVFGAQFLLNLGWSAVFFGARSIGGGLLVITGLWVAIVATIVAFDRVDRRAAVLVVPYLAWVSFAAYLNYRFLVLN
ncbi:MAG: TspO/MBR family protein [Halobacteriaceae archaeon]